MTAIPDEILMAYADGELTRSERRAVREAIARDPSLALRLDQFLLTSSRSIGPAFADVMRVPQRLVEVVQGADRTRPVGAPQKRRLFDFDSAPRFRFPAWAMAGVASSLVIGAALGFWVAQPSGSDRELAMDQSLQRTLESVPAGKSATLASVELKSTFRSKAGAWCRQYELEQTADQRFSAVACRDEGGHWRIEAQAALPMRTGKTGGAYAPAAGSSRAPAVEAAVDRLIEGIPLGREEEERVIAGKWKSVP